MQSWSTISGETLLDVIGQLGPTSCFSSAEKRWQGAMEPIIPALQKKALPALCVFYWCAAHGFCFFDSNILTSPLAWLLTQCYINKGLTTQLSTSYNAHGDESTTLASNIQYLLVDLLPQTGSSVFVVTVVSPKDFWKCSEWPNKKGAMLWKKT